MNRGSQCIIEGVHLTSYRDYDGDLLDVDDVIALYVPISHEHGDAVFQPIWRLVVFLVRW